MANEPQTKAYTLKPGAKHVHNGVLLADGATVQFTDQQFQAFRDKFAPAGSKVPAVIPAAVGEVAQNNIDSIQDFSAKTPDPLAPVTNPGNVPPGASGLGTKTAVAPVTTPVTAPTSKS